MFEMLPDDLLRQAKFSPGRIVATPAALALLKVHDILPWSLLARHLCGDWGSVSSDDAEANHQALQYGARLLSIYPVASNETVWLITEADRSATTFLLPEEY